MALPGRAARILSVVVATLCSVAYTQTTPTGNASKNSAAELLRQMVGTWTVKQRMWTGFGADATDLPAAIARRHLMAGGFLQEVMESEKQSGKASFTRTAYLNYNAVNQQYEYFSLDSRAPQMMNERSDKTEANSNSGGEAINLKGETFVAPQWGEAKNVAFAYRLLVGKVENSRQIVRLYLTPQAGASPKEFLAFEYVYTRQR